MGIYVNKKWIQIMAWVIALVIVSLNVKLVIQEITDWLTNAGENSWMIWITAVPVCVAAACLLVYITIKPYIEKRKEEREARVPHGKAAQLEISERPGYNRIAITIDFSKMDSLTIQSALAQGGKGAKYILLHVVETAGAMVYGSDIEDQESAKDSAELENYKTQLIAKGYDVEMKIGFGNPRKRIPEMVNDYNADLLVMGAHGHELLKDLIFGTTVDTVRHRVKIPVLIVRG